MVRINRTYSIEEDIVNKLKEEANVSELINSLLINYFNKSNSKDLRVLKKKVDEIETNLDILRRERDRVTDDIREIENQTEVNKLAKEEDLLREAQVKSLSKWLADKVKTEELTFEEYHNIKNLDNWEDCIEAVQKGSLAMEVLIEKSKPREEPIE